MRLVEISESAGRKVNDMRLRLHGAERRFLSVLSMREQREFLRALGRLQAAIDEIVF
jgi:hypothetical protein